MRTVTILILAGILVLNSCNSTSDNSSKLENELANSKPKNVILMIGDGMGIAQIQAAYTVKNQLLNMEQCKVVGLSKTSSASSYITDSAAGATAFSIGKKTYNGAIGVDADTIPQTTILEYAERAGLSTGLVATSAITHATPAAFIAHQPSRKMADAIALDFLATDIDVFIGGGKRNFMARKDGLNLKDSLKVHNYQMAYTLDEMEAIVTGKMAALLSDSGMLPYKQGRGEMLVPATQKAIDLVSSNEKGFFLMIEGSQIDWGGHANDMDYMVSELLDFDNAVAKALDFAKKDGNTLVVITADHETGGLSLLGKDVIANPSATHFSTSHHTAVMVPVFAYGPGAENFSGVYQNNQIFKKLMEALNLNKK